MKCNDAAVWGAGLNGTRFCPLLERSQSPADRPEAEFAAAKPSGYASNQAAKVNGSRDFDLSHSPRGRYSPKKFILSSRKIRLLFRQLR